MILRGLDIAIVIDVSIMIGMKVTWERGFGGGDVSIEATVEAVVVLSPQLVKAGFLFGLGLDKPLFAVRIERCCQ